MLFLTFVDVGAARAQQTTVTVHIDRQTLANAVLTLEFPQRNKISFGRPYAENEFYRSYRANITWPVGNRIRRSDFEVYARVQNNNYTKFYLRFSRNERNVELFIFNPVVTACERIAFPIPSTEEAMFQQIATAEAMFRISGRGQRCTPESLRYWTEIWIDRLNRLRRRNIFIRVNPEIVEEIEKAYAQPYGIWPLRRRITPPPALQEILRKDEQLSSQFES